MKSSNHLILTTSPLSQTTKKNRKTANLVHMQRLLYGRKLRYHTGKERDNETGLYYYGARYLDSKTSRWLSGDPAMGEYIPEAPINDGARKRNGNLPGMGGVFNVVNLHVYHYAGNNPVKYTDPDGEKSENELVKEEKNVTRSKLTDVIKSPEKYTIHSYERKAIVAYPGKRSENAKHSFYVFENNETGEEFTLSFNGTAVATSSKGAWLINTRTDQESISNEKNMKKWDLEPTTPDSGINVEKTAKNIIKKIDNPGIRYWALDGITTDRKNYDNCNTALQETRVSN